MPDPVLVRAAPGLLPTGPAHRGVLVWRPPTPPTALSSAAVGGGLTRPAWVVNVGVDKGFARTDLAAYVAELAASLGLEGEGCALLTAADVAQVQASRSGGVLAWATVGVTRPTWAVRPEGSGSSEGAEPSEVALHAGGPDDRQPPPPGTINLVVSLPVPLSTSALVQAVGTATEAKAQALLEAGVPGTGTASDAVVVTCPGLAGRRPSAPEVGPARSGEGPALSEEGPEGPVAFAGVRSPWGEHIARAVREAVAAGLAAHPWPPDDGDPGELGVVW
ncbi:hypothetical protein DV701_11620 [Ornithinimicrobium avium]|uniref:Adenosylcobinamide amidohydrolase n=1 Tax=Ornithinimicrobium avium TaxID=2283195 RepID=A0A345NSR6_9MICO|nr:hypothetical protein DV701_11620 [Ornithinimicrobium avium]